MKAPNRKHPHEALYSVTTPAKSGMGREGAGAWSSMIRRLYGIGIGSKQRAKDLFAVTGKFPWEK